MLLLDLRVEYLDCAGSRVLLPEGRPKVDCKEVLNPEEFEVFKARGSIQYRAIHRSFLQDV